MMMKMIAIGILALLGLSSVMNPKAFRVFLGGLGALCMALFVGFVVLGDRLDSAAEPRLGHVERLTAMLQTVLGIQPNWQESAAVTSQKLLDDLKKGQNGGDVPSTSPPVGEATSHPSQGPVQQASASKRLMLPKRAWRQVEIDRSSEEQERMSTVAKIRAVMAAYLEDYAARSEDIGVAQLVPEDLNPKLLKLFPTGVKDGKILFKFAFDDDFDRYVRLRGKQKAMRQRLQATTYGAALVVAFLSIGYGLIKVLNSRKRYAGDVDYLKASDVSMV